MGGKKKRPLPAKDEEAPVTKKQKTSESNDSPAPAAQPDAPPPVSLDNLDTKAIHDLHQAGKCVKGLVQQCHFSLNTLASAKSLQSVFFRDIAADLKSLNLSGVKNLTIKNLKLALKKTSQLTDLDVTCTPIMMPDFLVIAKVGKALTGIAMNFAFGHNRKVIPKKLLTRLTQAFRRFKDVKFVGAKHETFRLGDAALQILEQANLSNLTFVIDSNYNTSRHKFVSDESEDESEVEDDNEDENKVDDESKCKVDDESKCKDDDESKSEDDNEVNDVKKDDDDDEDDEDVETIEVKQCRVDFLQGINDMSALSFPLFNLLNVEDYEIIIFHEVHETKHQSVNATPKLIKIIKDEFDTERDGLEYKPDSSEELVKTLRALYNSKCLTKRLAIMFWNKEQTSFDEQFNSHLKTIFKKHYVFNTDISKEAGVLVPDDYEWYRINDHLLHYKKYFGKKENIKCIVALDDETLSENDDLLPLSAEHFDFMKQITHLSLCFKGYKCESDFFDVLFQKADSLETLEIVDYRSRDRALLEPIRKSKSLKNIYLMGDIYYFSSLYECLSKCKSLENIQLVYTDILFDLPNPEVLFRKCENLHSFRVQSTWQGTYKGKKRNLAEEMDKMYNKVKTKLKRHYLNIDFQSSLDHTYSPNESIFKALPTAHSQPSERARNRAYVAYPARPSRSRELVDMSELEFWDNSNPRKTIFYI